eukprot:TRINITY_DN9832_c5_g1_i1.p1 TRINITY_DN9832_c5_g1~~TRINITY_DN9832_c5_g1_i1.p1  ORF type:complete len:417 (-),score=102.72 TRINITY_DN9832_c5_g1_i1:39-1214(-)
MAEECFGRLRELCLGGHLSGASRERLIRSAIGPLLSCLEEAQLVVALESIAAPLRAAAPVPPAGQNNVAPPSAIASWRLLFKLFESIEPPRPELPLELLSKHWPWFEASINSSAASEASSDAACDLLCSAVARARSSRAAEEALQKALPTLAVAASDRGSASALGAMASLTRVFRGGSNDAQVSLIAAQTGGVSQRLLEGGELRVQQLPQDLLSALLELLSVALAPRCKALALQLLTSSEMLATLIGPIVSVLSSSASPRIVCWGLLVVDRLPPWLKVQEAEQNAKSIVERLLPVVSSTCCRLLASSPVMQDSEVSSALAQALLTWQKALPQAFGNSLAAEMSSLNIAEEEAQLLLQQIADPLASELVLSEALREASEVWQVEHLRQALSR